MAYNPELDAKYIPKNGFMFHMTEIQEFTQMFYGLADFQRMYINARVTEKQFKIGCNACRSSINFLAEFWGEDFLAYHVNRADTPHQFSSDTEGEGITWDFCFDPTKLKKMISKHQNRTMMWVYDGDNPTKLRILLFQEGERDCVWDFETTLNAHEKYTDLVSPFIEPDHSMGHKTSVIATAIKDLLRMDFEEQWLSIEVDADKIRFSMKRGICVTSSSILIYRDEEDSSSDEDEADEEEDGSSPRKKSKNERRRKGQQDGIANVSASKVKMNSDALEQFFVLSDLERCLPCITVNKKLLTVHMTKNWPLQLVTTVGSNGIIKLSIVSFPRSEVEKYNEEMKKKIYESSRPGSSLTSAATATELPDSDSPGSASPVSPRPQALEAPVAVV